MDKKRNEPAAMDYTLVRGEIQVGHGVASGKGKDKRYPEGTLKQQFAYFLERGLDLSNYFMGTVNVDISPCPQAKRTIDIRNNHDYQRADKTRLETVEFEKRKRNVFRIGMYFMGLK